MRIDDGTTVTELALVSQTLEAAGIKATLSGGAAVSIYTDNEYGCLLALARPAVLAGSGGDLFPSRRTRALRLPTNWSCSMSMRWTTSRMRTICSATTGE